MSEVAMLRGYDRTKWWRLDRTLLLQACTNQLAQIRGASANPAAFLSMTETQLAEWLKSKVPDDGAISLSRCSGRHSRTVLGASLLARVREDMEKTILPDWITPAPLQLGSKSHGKLSANEWRSVVTIHLPITLISLWGQMATNTRWYQMLVHFMQLAIVVNLVARRTTSFSWQKAIVEHMVTYLHGIQSLFADASIVPNHHIALHVVECLKNFGPPHLWWAFPYERLNGLLQKIETNNRFHESFNRMPSDLERSITRWFGRATNLRALLQDNLLPSSVSGFYTVVKTYLKTQYVGFLDIDNKAVATDRPLVFPDLTRTNDSYTKKCFTCSHRKRSDSLVQEAIFIYDTLGCGIWDIQICSHIFHHAATFSPIEPTVPIASREARNSSIQYRNNGSIAFGRIMKIVHLDKLTGPSEASSAKTKVIVQPYRTLSPEDASQDLFRNQAWASVGAELVYAGIEETFHIVSPLDIVAHVAVCPFSAPPGQFEQETLIVWPLDWS
ncbi:hypothetical protein FRB99_003669 [Tulasnella sp. 403]|nr:hypothetical protein FRB99_003669 [Tulasnella sp. 403]